MDDGSTRAIPLREGGIGPSRDLPKRGTGDNLEERVVHLLEIRFKVTLNVDDESGCDRREQTGLFSTWGSHKYTNIEVYGKNAHKYQCAIQIFVVFLDKVVVVIVRRALEPSVELDGGVVGRPEARKESRQRFEHGVLHAENDGKKGD